MTDLSPDLKALGDALERAAAADLGPAQRVPRRRLLLAAAIAVIAVPSLAFAADKVFISTNDVAASMPAGTLSLAGTEPKCTIVEENVEYHCVLTNAPAHEVSDFKGVVEPTVDSTSHVNGGCRGLTSDGLEWECYIGQAAVQQQIVGKDFLGQYSSGPGVG